MQYKGVTIERNIHGYFTAWLEYEGRYIQCDTLSACKHWIREYMEKLDMLTNHKTKN